MLTIGEFIVGLWFLPVVIFNVIPLTMFAIWLLMQTGKKTKAATEKVNNVLDNGDSGLNERTVTSTAK